MRNGGRRTSLGEAFFVSRRFASHISLHEISDLKKAIVLSLRAEYTRLGDKQKILSTREMQNGDGFRACSRQKGGKVRIIVNVGIPCARLPLWSTWLRRLTIIRTTAGSNPVSVITFLYLSFTFMVKIVLSHPPQYAWGTCGANLLTTLYLARR